MEDIRIIAKELLDDLENVKSDNLNSKIRHQEKMKKIISLNDEIILSQDVNDLSIKINCLKDISNVYSFFLKSPELKDRERFFLE